MAGNKPSTGTQEQYEKAAGAKQPAYENTKRYTHINRLHGYGTAPEVQTQTNYLYP